MAWSDFFLKPGSQSYDDAQAHIAAQEAALNAKVAARQADNSISPDLADYYYSNQGPAEDQNAAAAAGFVQGAEQGAENVLEAPGWLVGLLGKATGTLTWGIIKNIPWWVYLAAGVALFFWLDGPLFVRAIAKRKLSTL